VWIALTVPGEAMNHTNSKWDRTELYEKVWEFPLRKLAGEFGVSNVALAKVCRKLQIPLPGLGYWRKIECGQLIERPSLPEAKELPVLTRRIRARQVSILPEDLPRLQRIEEFEKTRTPPFLGSMLTHPLVEKTKQLLIGARNKDRGIFSRGRQVDWLDLRVSKNCLERSLQIMAMILRLFEQEGFKVVVEKRGSESTSALIYGEKIRFGLIERSRQVKPAASVVNKAKASTNWPYRSIKLEPTGRLSIEVRNYYLGGLRKVWEDSDRVPLEEQLPRCVAGMMRIALRERAERAECERKEEARRRRIEEVELILRGIEAEEKKIKLLEREARNWHRAQRIREYASAVRQQQSSDHKANVPEWVEWALRQADRIDPTKETPHSVVDDKEDAVRRLRQVERQW
jgi:hypothetical protein